MVTVRTLLLVTLDLTILTSPLTGVPDKGKGKSK